jgi:hypothetical protein
MTDRLPLHTINIPDNAAKIRAAAGQLVIDALREAGIDPIKAVHNPLCVALVHEWGHSLMTRETFIHSCRNLLIMNPALAANGATK